MLFEATYNYAGFAITAAQDENKNYWISEMSLEKLMTSNNACCTFRTREKLESNVFKAFAGASFEPAKISDKTQKQHKNSNYFSLSTFLTLVAWQNFEGNINAQSFCSASLVADFTASLKHHFGEVFTEDEKEYLRVLVFNRIANFKAWTTIIRDRHIALFGTKPQDCYYRDCVVEVNLHLFGVAHFNCDRGNMTTLQQDKINEFEKLMVRIAAKYPAFSPKAIIKKSLELYDMMF